MSYTPGTTISKVAFLINKLDSEGINTHHMLLDLKIDPAIFDSPENNITLKELQKLFIKTSEITDDEHFGLHHGNEVELFPNILAHILVNCSSIGDAAKKYIRYHSLTDPGNILELTEENGKSILVYSACDNELDQDKHLTAYRLACLKRYIEILSVEKVDLKQVLIRHETPEDSIHYFKVFGAPVIFNSNQNALVYNRSISKIPVKAPNKELLVFFEKHAQMMLEELRHMTPFAHKVTRVITDLLSAGVPQINQLAAEFGISVRTLQQNLQEEGTTYTEILENTRKKMAESYMKDKNIPFSEISYLIGFSEPSVFFRSFKKWNGMTPGEYRRKVLIEEYSI